MSESPTSGDDEYQHVAFLMQITRIHFCLCSCYMFPLSLYLLWLYKVLWLFFSLYLWVNSYMCTKNDFYCLTPLISILSVIMSMTLTLQRAHNFSWVRSRRWVRPSFAIIWQHEKHSVYCGDFFNTQPSPDRRRKNSHKWLGSCWSPSTSDVSLSVIIFHACHVDQIYTACVLFIRPIMWDEGGARAHVCAQRHVLICISSDLIPLGWCGQIKNIIALSKNLLAHKFQSKSDLGLNETGID